MQRERLNKQNKPGKETKEGYIIVPNTFLKKWVKVLGVGPVVLYQELLTYCHKEKTIAWPTINSLCQQMGTAKTTLLRYQNTLIKFGLIKNIARGKSTTGHYKNNIYRITSLEELPGHPDPGKIIDFLGSKMKPDRYQNDTNVGSNLKLSLVSNRYPNNNNINNTNTTTNREKDAVAAVVNFKKLKEKGDLSASTCAYPHVDRCNAQAEEKMPAPYSINKHYTGQAMKERMVALDFKEEFIKKILGEYSMKKIEEKLDLLMERRNIQSPAGWLRAALKNDYQDGRPEDIPIQVSSISEGRGSIHRARNQETGRINPSPTKTKTNSGDNNKILSSEEARRQFHLLRHKLMAMNCPQPKT
jgi:hypothetical protein